jgi:hypothetical protein
MAVAESGRRPRWVLVLAIVLAILGLAIAGLFAARMIRRGRPPPPRQTDVSMIAQWMTVPYVARGFRVPPDELYRALGAESGDRRDRRSIGELATASGHTPDEGVRIVQDTVMSWQATHAEPAGGPRTKDGAPRGPPAGGGG